MKVSRFNLAVVFIFALNIFHFKCASAEESSWEAPAEEVAKPNLIQSSDDAIVAGKAVYKRRCEGCHGETGKGDGPDAADLAKEPAKLSSSDLSKESDGALFWKISTGKKPMPKYGTRLSADQIWQVVHYVRSLAKQNS